MPVWTEIRLQMLKGFEEGVKDARRHAVSQIAYQINQEYRSGVDIARELSAKLREFKQGEVAHARGDDRSSETRG